jgi:DNA-binding NtrC family response regulator
MKPLLRQDITKLISECPAPSATVEASPSIRNNDSSFHMEELDNGSFFLAASPVMIQLYDKVRLLAEVDYPVLILGESGVGKEVVARLLHKYHARCDKPFVNVNTAAIPSELLESELFGFEAGAFTGALKAKPGKFEVVDQGTLLLDEIGEMSLQMQAKLLHVLQDGTFSRLGSRSSTRVDVRILAATNVDMETAIAEKRFREDLYYRINAFTISVPSLRERREEIPILIEQMLARASASAGRTPFTFSRRLIEAAQEYHWPGNLRELRNFVTRLMVLQDQDAAYEDLRTKTKRKNADADVASSIAQTPGLIESLRPDMKRVVDKVKHQTESRLIKEALSASGWNRRRAAINLNISYRALLYKIQQHGLKA